MDSTVFWFLLLAISLGLVVWAAQRPNEEAVRRWADAREVPLTDQNAGLVFDYLRRTRLLRTIGGVAGLFLSQTPALLSDAWPNSAYSHTFQSLSRGPLGNGALIVVGYLVGALVAEYTRPRGMEGPGQRAALVPRELDDYADLLSRGILWGSVAASVALVPAAAVVPVSPGRTPPSASGFALQALTILGIVVVVGWLERLIVRRPQPFVAPDLVSADDAARASSIHAVAGVGLVLVLGVLGSQLGTLGLATSLRPLRWTLWLLGLVAEVGGIGLWLGYGSTYAWVVRRRLVRA